MVRSPGLSRRELSARSSQPRREPCYVNISLVGGMWRDGGSSTTRGDNPSPSPSSRPATPANALASAVILGSLPGRGRPSGREQGPVQHTAGPSDDAVPPFDRCSTVWVLLVRYQPGFLNNVAVALNGRVIHDHPICTHCN